MHKENCSLKLIDEISILGCFVCSINFFISVNAYLLVRNQVNQSVSDQLVDQSAVSHPGDKPANKCLGVKCFETRIRYVVSQLRFVTQKVALVTFFSKYFPFALAVS